MVFGIKKKKKVVKKKNVSKTFVDGKETVVEEAPETIPELEIPIPPPEDSSQTAVQEKPLMAEDVFAEGRSVGFQEGMIFAINLVQDHLQKHQEELKAKLKEVQQ